MPSRWRVRASAWFLALGACSCGGSAVNATELFDAEPIRARCSDLTKLVAQVLEETAFQRTRRRVSSRVGPDTIETDWSDQAQQTGERWIARLRIAGPSGCWLQVAREARLGGSHQTFLHPRQVDPEMEVLAKVQPFRAMRIRWRVARTPPY
jgi:hypothetical protein